MRLRRLVHLLIVCTVYICLLSHYQRVREMRHISQIVQGRILVSYVYHEPLRSDFLEVRNKRQNLHVFIKKGYVDDQRYTFVFTISGSWPSAKEFFTSLGHQEEKSILPVGNNVISLVRDTQTVGADLCYHSKTINSFGESHGMFVFLNDGVRGPFTDVTSYTNVARGSWLYPFIRSAANPRVSIVGARISCEVAWHAQTYFVVIKRAFINEIVKHWAGTCDERNWAKVIREGEVGVSQNFLKQGFAIASPAEKKLIFAGTPVRDCTNPSLKYIDLEKAVMIKYGGEIFRLRLLHNQTLTDVARWMMLNFPYINNDSNTS